MAASPQTPSTNQHTMDILGCRWLSEGTFELELTRPPLFDFVPGQRIRLLHRGLERDYSLVSTPAEATLSLCIRRVEPGQLSPLLAAAEIGSRLQFSGPHGYFTFRPSPRPAVFVATGTGIAPFVSMARCGVRSLVLLHGVRVAGDLYYASVLRTATQRYVPCLSAGPPASASPFSIFHGHVTEYLEEHLEPGVYDFYLCGRTEMIRDVTLLVDRRFPGSYVYTEAFF
jgi:benzoate/toluate 1,2-dioxygenase reductase component